MNKIKLTKHEESQHVPGDAADAGDAGDAPGVVAPEVIIPARKKYNQTQKKKKKTIFRQNKNKRSPQ